MPGAVFVARGMVNPLFLEAKRLVKGDAGFSGQSNHAICGLISLPGEKGEKGAV